MTAMRQLTLAGIWEFERFLTARRLDPNAPCPNELLSSPEMSEPLSFRVELNTVEFATRLDASQYLADCCRDLEPDSFERNTGFWSWLALYYFDQLCPKGMKPGESYRYILATGGGTNEIWHAYRHLLASPFLIYKANLSDPPLALLCGPVYRHGEVAEQLASSMDLITNPVILAVANQLYFDPSANGLRRGGGGKGPGSPRRFVSVIKQLDLTYDLYGLSSVDLLALLPPEFDRFKL